MPRQIFLKDHPTPDRYFHNAVTLEATLFNDPRIVSTKAGTRYTLATVVFRGWEWGADGERKAAGPVRLKIWTRGEQAQYLGTLTEGARVLMTGWFATENFHTDDGELKVLLTFLAQTVEPVTRVFDRSKDLFPEKRPRKKP